MDHLKMAIAKRRQRGMDKGSMMGEDQDAMGIADPKTTASQKSPEMAPERESMGGMGGGMRDAAQRLAEADFESDEDEAPDDHELMESMADGNENQDGDGNMDGDSMKMLMSILNEDQVGKPGLSGKIADGIKARLDKLKAIKQG